MAKPTGGWAQIARGQPDETVAAVAIAVAVAAAASTKPEPEPEPESEPEPEPEPGAELEPNLEPKLEPGPGSECQEAADIPSRLRRIEPNGAKLTHDLVALAVYFAKVGFNTGLFIKKPHSALISESLDHARVMALVQKYNLKMNLDKRFNWIAYPEPRAKLRIYHVALTYGALFIQQAASTRPLDFDEERFWKCAKNHDFWRSCKRAMKHLSGHSKREVRAQHSSSRLLSVAILPLLTMRERRLITIWALSIEVRKGAPDRRRFGHFMREALRHVRSNVMGEAYPREKERLRRKFAIEEAERELERSDVDLFFELWDMSADKRASVRFEEHLPRPICVRHLERLEPDGATRAADLAALASHFCRLHAEQRLLLLSEQQQQQQQQQAANQDAIASEALKLAQKYHIQYSPVINQFSIKRYEREGLLTIDGVAREHLELFIDAAAQWEPAESEPDCKAAEEQFWRCANNFTYWQRNSKRARKCKRLEQRLCLAPNRLLACGFYRLLTLQEPKLIELYALRAPNQRAYEYVKYNILYQIEKNPLEHDELKRRLRARYKVEEAERQLQPVELSLFLKLRQLDEDKCFKADTLPPPPAPPPAATVVEYEHADYLKRIEPNELQLETELVQLARHFNGLGSVFLLDNRNLQIRAHKEANQNPDDQDVKEHSNAHLQAYQLAFKYHVVYSRVCHTDDQVHFLVRLHRLVSDHLRLFVDTAAAAQHNSRPSADERRFWWCANNLAYLAKYNAVNWTLQSREQLYKTAPNRLVSIGMYRLLTSREPKLMALAAWRAAAERRDRRLNLSQFESIKRTIEFINEKLDARLGEPKRIHELRLRYDIERAESELELVDGDLFVKRWNETTASGWQHCGPSAKRPV